MDQQRRSTIVLVTAIGIPAAFAASEPFLSRGPTPQMQRNLYADRAACERDYPANQCEQGGTSGSSTSSGGHGCGSWHGPSYRSDRSTPEARSDPGPGRTGTTARAGVETISTRGGFGAFGRAMRAV
ncbi:MAG: hypothetical protein JO008_07745, partial [Alphaproteobacteria bacterium]|nr:hypothetical protein [Alphaproteobacteria bacterium]